jgi:hypothetical protein
VKRLELQLMQKIDGMAKDEAFWPKREQDRRACEALLTAGYLKTTVIPIGGGSQRGYRADKRKAIYREAKSLGLF